MTTTAEWQAFCSVAYERKLALGEENSYFCEMEARTVITCRPILIWLACALVSVSAIAQNKDASDAPRITIQPIADTTFGYDLMHLEIVAEGSLPSQGEDFSYRVISVPEQGNCVGMCPATPLYVVLGNISAKRDEKVTLYRIDGIRFMHFPTVTTLEPNKDGGFVLSVKFTSIPHPGVPQHYIARIGLHNATVERDGPDIPKASHQFGHLFQRDDAAVFRVKLADGTVYRLTKFEVFDTKIYGQSNAWSALVVESSPGPLRDPPVEIGARFGPILESDIIEIYDERVQKVVFRRD
jgi:desulfoferrodoxin (superoxide reductase-like protein)